MKIVIDGYNVALQHGTGIKTHTLLMQQALAALGHETMFLYGLPAYTGPDELLREVTFYDALVRGLTFRDDLRASTIGGRIQKSIQFRLAASGNSTLKAAEIPTRHTVVSSGEEAPVVRTFNSRNLYDLALTRHLVGRRFTKVRFPETVDIFHTTYPLPVKLKNCRQVVTIHDIIPLRLPYTTLEDKREVLARHRIASKNADLIITVSDHSKADICEYLGVPDEKVAVVRAPSRLFPLTGLEMRERPRVLRRYGLSPQGYILFVGAIEPKKNLRRLLQAYGELDLDVPIVIAGPRGWLWEDQIGWIETAGARLKRNIRFLNHVPLTDLPFIYSGAMFLAFPSIYEGYGLPIIEAQAFGLPVLTSATSSMPEVGGEAALYVDPFSVQDIREKLQRLVSDADLRSYLSEKALEQASKLNMETFTADVKAAYSKL